jgi:predicted secreted protein
MMKTWAALFFGLILGNPDNLSASEMMKLTENNSGKTVELRIGDELEITLPGNPTTGYVWEVSSLDTALLKQENPAFLPADKSIGSGGLAVMKLHAIGEGCGELKLIYHRPFEQNNPPLKIFKITVIIEK